MKRILLVEFKRMLKCKSLFISIFFSISMVFLSYLDCIKIYMPEKNARAHSFIVAWLPLDFQYPYGMMFVALIPIIACIPYSGTYYIDLKSGYLKNILQKVSSRKYFICKYIVCFTVGALSILIPLFVSFLLASSFLPISKPEPFAYENYLTDTSFLTYFFYQKPVLYVFCYLFLDSFWGGIFAVSSLCIARYVNSLFAVLVLPFAFYMGTAALFEQFDMTTISLYAMANPLQPYQLNGICVFVISMCLFLFTIYFFCVKERSKEVF